jgi:flagellar motor switch protein FliM
VWAKALPFPAEPKPGPVESVTAGAALRSLPDDAIGVPVSLPGPADGNILIVMRRPFLIALLAGFLGEAPEALPEDRDPTDLEASLVEYVVRELFLDPLERGWPSPDPIRLTAGSPGAPRASWAGPPSDMILLASITATTPFGDQQIHLMLTRTGRWDRLSSLPPGRGPQTDPAIRKQIEALVREMPVDLAVVLGTVELTMSAVARLKAGDVVVLRQKVTDPLDGLVAGSRKFRVWPGAVGAKAAIQIHTPAED